MKIVDLYLENGGKSPKSCKGWYGYVLEYQGRYLHTRQHFEETEGTRQERDLEMLLDALKRCKDCQIRVHTDESYLEGGYERLPHYVNTEWITARGDPVKHKELWMEVMEQSQEKPLEFVLGPHEYTGWLRTEIERRKKGDTAG